MEIIVDTSAILSVLLNEPTRAKILSITHNSVLVVPGSVKWEIQNAVTALFKRNRLSLEDGLAIIESFSSIPIREYDVDYGITLMIGNKYNIYAYDAFFISLCKTTGLPLLTLDNRLRQIADLENIKLPEI